MVLMPGRGMGILGEYSAQSPAGPGPAEPRIPVPAATDNVTRFAVRSDFGAPHPMSGATTTPGVAAKTLRAQTSSVPPSPASHSINTSADHSSHPACAPSRVALQPLCPLR